MLDVLGSPNPVFLDLLKGKEFSCCLVLDESYLSEAALA